MRSRKYLAIRRGSWFEMRRGEFHLRASSALGESLAMKNFEAGVEMALP